MSRFAPQIKKRGALNVSGLAIIRLTDPSVSRSPLRKQESRKRQRELPMPQAKTLERIARIIGTKNLLTHPSDTKPYLTEWRGNYRGKALCIALPLSPKDISEIVKLAAKEKLHIVPQSGNTGLVGGQIPFDKNRAILVSLARMNKIRELNPTNNSITAEAGCILANLHHTAETANRLFPLTLASKGSSQLGGLLATNAGGHNVLRYGMARDLTLGLECVLANGKIWHGLRALRKDNRGYDLKNLFIGSEGTLGIITAAVLKLFPMPKGETTFLAGLQTPQQALDCFHWAQARSGGALSAFELIPRIGMDFVLKHIPETRDPIRNPSPCYLLGALDSEISAEDASEKAQAILSELMEKNLIKDAVLTSSEARRQALWKLRESMSEAQKREGASLKHDISVPLSKMARFLEEAEAAVKAFLPEARIVAFGHIGDGNLHINISQPVGMSADDFLALREKIGAILYDLVESFDGSISAEHGIGVLKRDELARRKSQTELEMMRQIKRALDPDNLFNPGKLL